MTLPLLEVQDLTKHFPIKAGFFKRVVGTVRAVDGISFNINSGQTMGLVGESGCGKTTTGRMVLRLIERTAGRIIMRVNDDEVDVAALQGEELRLFRRHMQMIFQDPYSSLNPRMTVRDLVSEPLRTLGGGLSGREIDGRVKELMEWVGLNPRFLPRFPHAFSGGQRQRICIARALAVHPRLVVCDEPVSALDVSVQAQIINLLKDLQQSLGLTYLFVAHDLSVVENISTHVAVMYAGRIVETAHTEVLYSRPRHPYTEALMRAVPKPTPRKSGNRLLLQGEVADPSTMPTGCPFHPRCRFAEDRCRQEVPPLREIGDGQVACHFAEQLDLSPAAG